MSITCPNTNPLQREGTTQVQRLLDALVPENVKLHELKEEDWLRFARNYAALISFYNDETAERYGDWEDFFVDEDQIGSFLETLDSGDVNPHLSLFVAFLKLLEYPQKSINGLPKRHLDFYYRDVLKLSPKEFTPDAVHLIFELAKNAIQESLPVDTKFEAGKDSNGKLLNYNLDKEIILNKGKVEQIKSLYLNDSSTLKYALQSNTLDGLEEELEDDLSWSGFGDSAWQDLPIEIALSSKVLSMKEGLRKVTITWETAEDMKFISGTAEAIITGEKGWLDPLTIDFESDNKVWKFEMPEDMDAVGNYSEDLHEKKLNTTHPAVIIKFSNANNYGKLQNVKITSAKIAVEVTGVKSISVENELGSQTPDKAFMPFGSRPKKQALMTIDVDEFLGKNITSYGINMPWLNMPANFTSHYSAYSGAITTQKNEEIANSGYLIGHISLLGVGSNINLNPVNPYTPEVVEQFSLKVEEDTMRKEFLINVSSPYHENGSSHAMFNEPLINKLGANGYLKGGKIEVRLLSSFYHDLYNPIYVNVITANDPVPVDKIPKEPYTPLTSGVSINYTAESKLTFDTSTAKLKDVELHQITPFGTKYVKSSDNLISKVPLNTLYIGITGVEPRNVIALLFQVAEGSESPDDSSFSGDEIKWSVLTDEDEWLSIDDNIISDATNNFLASGIVEISLPKETGLQHYLLDTGMVWLKVTLNKPPVGVSRFFNIHAQAGKATFVNNDNTLEHLATGLDPELIVQLAKRKSKVKSVIQPYTSIGGKPTESDDNFYRRISERLRHKDRALTIWDYERLILQDFPQLHKVKCLNHTLKTPTSVDELSPGNVTIVVIPKIKNSASEYRLEPTVSQNTKDVIKDYIMPKKPMHVQLEVTNPIYEPVDFTFNVRFYEGIDYKFHEAKVIEDLRKYIAPWIAEDELNLTFGRSIYKYEVINYLENLEYVDYLENFSMAHKPFEKPWIVKNEIFPSNSLAVLIPGKNHIINEAIKC